MQFAIRVGSWQRPLLALYGSPYLLPAVTAVVAALLWGALCTCVSLWTGVRFRAFALAAACAYALTSVALPLGIGTLTTAIATGCSVGHPNHDFVFRAAAALTWSILVIGSAATFWDVTWGRLFPETRRSLWQEGDN